MLTFFSQVEFHYQWEAGIVGLRDCPLQAVSVFAVYRLKAANPPGQALLIRGP